VAKRERYRFSVKDRVLLVATVPILTVTLLLGFHMIKSRLYDHVIALSERGRVIARNLALTSEFGLFAGNVEALERTARSFAHSHRDILRIEVLDAERQRLVAYSGVASRALPSTWTSVLLGVKSPFAFEEPVGLSTELADPLAEPVLPEASPADNEKPLGWVRVELAADSLVETEREIIRQSLVLLAVGLGISILMALVMGRALTRPIGRLLYVVNRIRRGDMKTRIRALSAGELGHLEQGFNAMAGDLESAQARLQQQVEDATRELQFTIRELKKRNNDLSVAQAEALAASRAKEEFLARMSHEIRTPLNAIIGFSRILGRERDSANAKEHIHVINQASTQLLYVVDDILNFTRIETGNVELEQLLFDLPERLDNLVAMVSHNAHEKGLELVSLIHSDVPEYVSGDAGRFSQVLLNLLNNALKFTDKGHVFLEVARQPAPPDEDWIRVSITDTGPGIRAREAERLFQPFAQADNTISRRHGGAGLGLAVAKRLTELMGGEIGVSGEPGKGTKFWVSLPVQVAAVGVQEQQGVIGLPEGRVVIYEEHPLARRALRAMLARIAVVLCNTGDFDAVERRLEDPAFQATGGRSLVVLGLSSDHLAGDRPERLFRRVRLHHAGPVLFLVGSDDWQPGGWLADDAQCRWLSKPARRRTLEKAVAGLLGHPVTGEPALPARVDSRPEAVGSGARILYVEDNAFNRQLLRSLLQSRHLLMEEAESGQAALHLTARNRYDAILMDLHLPGIDGRETARLIREKLAEDCPPIIVLTADVFVDSGRSPLPGVFDDSLIKPVSDMELDRVIERWILRIGDSDGRRPGQPAPPVGARAGSAPALDAVMKDRLRAESARLFELCREAWTRNDLDGMRDLVHQLKGLAGLGGGDALAASVRRLEAAVAGVIDDEIVAATLGDIERALMHGP
jgi:two-component system sensor histidine kinase BarA